MERPSKPRVGGGAKKIFYVLDTARKMGIANSAKALTAKNTCKACGLGMGGQAGGMTNELGEFPAVCNKSVQAQSSDIQPPIPDEIFDCAFDDFAELSAKQIESLGRLGKPLYKARGATQFKPADWAWALDYAADHFATTSPDRSFFYTSGRSSNEAGFVLQLMARHYGTNNINNCSYYCHQATSVGLASSIGTGTATVELADLGESDCIFVIGANPASNHPRFIHQLKACRDRGGDVIVINPAREPGLVKFALPKSARSLIAGGSDIASVYVQPRIGSDIALFKGIAKALLTGDAIDHTFIDTHTSGFTAYREDIEATSWNTIETETGLSKAVISDLAVAYARANRAVFAWGMGMTHHQHGVENVESIANIALLRGMIAQRGKGLLPLRGHSNVQGIGTIGVKPIVDQEIIAQIQQQLGIELVSSNSKGMDTLSCLQAAESENIDVALIMGGNLLQASPQTAWAAEAMKKIKLKVFMTTTLNKGHIESLNSGGDDEALILPVCVRDEEPEPTTQESMFNFVRLSDGGIERIQNARSEIDVLVDLALSIQDKKNKGDTNKFDYSVFRSRSSLRQVLARTIPGLEQLKDIDVAKKEFHVSNRLMHKPIFRTSNGKANFQVVAIPAAVNDKRFPLRAMTTRTEGQFNSIVYEEQDSYRGVESRWSVLMSKQTMISLKLKSGDLVDVRSETGEMQGLKVVRCDLPENDLMLFYPEANVLTSQRCDPRSRTPAFKSIAVNVTKSV